MRAEHLKAVSQEQADAIKEVKRLEGELIALARKNRQGSIGITDTESAAMRTIRSICEDS